MPEGKVIAMPGVEEPSAAPVADPATPWGMLGFVTERDMLFDDFKTLDQRIKAAGTPAHAIAALSKRKQQVLDQIKQLDSAEHEMDDILDDSEDESWDVGS